MGWRGVAVVLVAAAAAVAAAAPSECAGGTLEQVTEACAAQLSPDAVAALSPSDVALLGGAVEHLSDRQVGGWRAAQCAALTPEAVRTLTGAQCAGLHVDCVRGLADAAVSSLTLACVGGLADHVVAQITPDFARAIPSAAWAGLSAAGLAALNPAVCAAMPPGAVRFVRSCRGVTQACLAALPDAAVAALHPSCVAQIRASVLRGIGGRFVAMLSDAAITAHTAPQIGVYTAEECSSFRSSAMIGLQKFQCANMTAGCASALLTPAHYTFLPQECNEVPAFNVTALRVKDRHAPAGVGGGGMGIGGGTGGTAVRTGGGGLYAAAYAPRRTAPRASGGPVIVILMLTLAAALYLAKAWIDPRVARLARGGVSATPPPQTYRKTST